LQGRSTAPRQRPEQPPRGPEAATVPRARAHVMKEVGEAGPCRATLAAAAPGRDWPGAGAGYLGSPARSAQAVAQRVRHLGPHVVR
jgi:hypothetical protein